MSHSRLFSADPMELVPFLVEDCIPGDVWKIGAEIVVRNNPLNAPIMHQQDMYRWYFFVPYRLLWRQWEKFYTGGVGGDNVSVPPKVNGVLSAYPWDAFRARGIGDYLGFNVIGSSDASWSVYNKLPHSFPLTAYYFIWNEYFRDQNVVRDYWNENFFPDTAQYPVIDLNLLIAQGLATSRGLMKKAWRKDYFTASLPFQQRGVTPSFGIGGSASLMNVPTFSPTGTGIENFVVNPSTPNNLAENFINIINASIQGTSQPVMHARGATSANTTSRAVAYSTAWNQLFGSLAIDTSNMVINANVHDMRAAFAITRFMELNARAGVRYVEFLKAHFPSFPRDDRLQRPEYVGGAKLPILVSEVLQTAESGSTGGVGNMLGHGISVDKDRTAVYRVQEPGVLMGICSFVPESMYQQGLERMWTKDTRYDYYFPAFQNLSEQDVRTYELYNYSAGYPVDDLHGFIGKYDEYRYRRNSVHGMFKNEFRYWHMGRMFGNAPRLNNAFLYPSDVEVSDPADGLKRVLQVPTEPMYLVHLGNVLKVARPMNLVPIPGLIDHM